MLDSERSAYSNQTIVLVAGMFSPRVTMLPMARRLKQSGYQIVLFRHRYLLETPAQNAQRLLNVLQRQSADTVHLLGHSLGGIVIMHALNMNSKLPLAERFANGRVVLIASPVQGSDFAKQLNSVRVLKRLLGRSVVSGVLGGAPINLDEREVGVISGSSRGGLSALVYKPPNANDGLVNALETRLENAQDSICVSQSHAAMLISRGCSDLAKRFFQYGRFSAK